MSKVNIIFSQYMYIKFNILLKRKKERKQKQNEKYNRKSYLNNMNIIIYVELKFYPKKENKINISTNYLQRFS